MTPPLSEGFCQKAKFNRTSYLVGLLYIRGPPFVSKFEAILFHTYDFAQWARFIPDMGTKQVRLQIQHKTEALGL